MTTKKLPKGWSTCFLEDLIIRMSNGANVHQYDEKLGLPITRIETIWNENIDLTRVKYIKENECDFLEKYQLNPGDILFSHINSDSHLGKTGLFKNQTKILIHGINLLLIRSSKNISSEFLNYQFKFLRNNGSFIDIAQRAVNQSSINQKKLKSLIFLVPPLNEQKRIVLKIEELFSEIDKGLENLLKAQELLRAYRQSILKNAFEGKLTEKWRRPEGQHLKSGKELLEQIIKERKQKWMSQKGYKDPILLDKENLPNLPNGWVWSSLDEIMNASPQNGVYYPQTSYGRGMPILRIDDFQINWIRPIEDLQLVEVTNQDKTLYALRDGDFVINRVNSLTHLGKTVCVSENYSGVLFESNMMRFSISTRISKEYLQYYLGSITGRNFLIKNCKHAVNQASINQQDVRMAAIPIPSKTEQDQITKIISEAFVRSEVLAKELEREFIKINHLRQSILRKAFCGELVSQDSNDEPASILLDRIKSEKNTQTPQKEKPRQLQEVPI